MKKLISVLAALSLAALMLFCCGCNDTTDETTVIRLNEVTHSVFYAPQYAAIKLGFFEEEGEHGPCKCNVCKLHQMS